MFGVPLRPIILGLLALTLSGLQPDAAGAQAITEKGLTFPETVAGLARGKRVDYEQQSPGLGFSFGYKGPEAAATAYVYDAGIAGIPAAAESDVVRRQMESAIGDVQMLVQRGLYQSAATKRQYKLRAGGRVAFLAAELAVERDGKALDSFIFLTGTDGNFVKIRYTTSHRAGSAAEAESFAATFAPPSPK